MLFPIQLLKTLLSYSHFFTQLISNVMSIIQTTSQRSVMKSKYYQYELISAMRSIRQLIWHYTLGLKDIGFLN